MILRSIVFGRPCGGKFSHFAHFIADFILPFYSYLLKHNFLDALLHGEGFTLELKSSLQFELGPLHPIAMDIFPGLRLAYVSRFSSQPIYLHRKRWHNNPSHLDPFVVHLHRVLPLRPVENKLIIVERGLDRQKYPGTTRALCGGADLRKIGQGLDRLIAQVKAMRPDALHVILEHLSFAEQVSLFLNADTLIGQHGAAFVHAHWMPQGGHLIELQCRHPRLCPGFVPKIAKLRRHRVSVVCYLCRTIGKCLTMKIGNCTKVTRLIASRPPERSCACGTENKNDLVSTGSPHRVLDPSNRSFLS